ncbi:MAG TPA: quinolinate synthase NadA [Spirochaetota bacterium]|nr:quinolinate synthase NadA [Spirochaetota bacterium]
MATNKSDIEIKELTDKIIEIKNKLGKRVIIPAHHYQRNEIVKLSDFIGDSYKLAKESSKTNSDYIVFCGVRFMAESAKILAKSNQKVLIPNVMAGCPMADMIDINNANKIWNIIEKQCERKIAPIVYMNSYADMKSFCGEKGGSVCTSSNAKKIIEYYLSKNVAIFFFPDYHLGKNIANTMNIPENQIAKVKKDATIETTGDPKNVKIFLYDGFCHVHQTFTESDILSLLRKKNSDYHIIVHPECKEEIVKLADSYGSTEQIYNTIKNSEPGSMWAVGTEYNFIQRMADEFKDKVIIPLRVSPCMNMEKINLENLYESLNSILEYENESGTLKYEVTVSDEYIEKSKTALQKMIDIVEGNI